MFWKKNVYKAEAGRWTFLPPNLFFQYGSHLQAVQFHGSKFNKFQIVFQEILEIYVPSDVAIENLLEKDQLLGK